MNYIKFQQGEKVLKIPINYDIVKKGKIAFDAYCEYKDILLKNFFAELEDFLLAEFLNSINNGRSLIKYDEKIYDYYNMVIGYYKAAVEAYDSRKNDLANQEIIKIADGIHDILECQINKFEEAFEKTDKHSNPVFREKEKIIDKNKKAFSKDIVFIYENAKHNLESFDVKDYFEDIYKVFFSAVKNCFIQLNDINSRRVTSFYYEALKQEREALSVIIKIQADVIERKIQFPEEEIIIQAVLMPLREGYQYLSKQIDDMEESFKEAVVYEKFICGFDDIFKNKIIFCFRNSRKKSKNSKKHFDYCNSVFIEMIKECSPEAVQIGKIETEVEEALFFSEKVISKFQFLYDFWKTNSEEYKNTDFKDIISGIAETIYIKIQNIKESAEEFLEASKRVILEVSKIRKRSKLFVLCKNCSRQNFMDISSQLSSVFDDYGLKSRKMQKMIIRLKKDNILFEISTFEEIMNYSVSRMRNSQNDCIKKFVQNIDFVFDELRQVLSVIGIEVIAPEPHDLFNGREHEVIMAEKNSDFKKGEIIKLMNSGYKEGNHVILRANVIAAK